jgi:hypothetical protein
MLEFYQLSKTKPPTAEEQLEPYANFKPICECSGYFMASKRRFHSIQNITPVEWGELHAKYSGRMIMVTGPNCECMSCKILERTDRYCVWEQIPREIYE